MPPPTHEPTALIIVDVQNDFLPPTGSLAVPDGREILPPIYKLLSDEEWVSKWNIVVVTQDWHPPGHISFASSHQGGKPYTKIQIPASSGTTKRSEQTAMRDMFIWPDHCVPGTPGAEIEDGLQERLRPWLADKKLVVVRKGYHKDIDAFSAFEGSVVTDFTNPLARTDEAKPTGPDIGSYLLEKGIKRCVVVGLATDYCVAQTTLSAASYPSTHSPGEKAFKTFVYTPAARGVNQDDSAKALAGMRERGAVLVEDEDGLRRVLKG